MTGLWRRNEGARDGTGMGFVSRWHRRLPGRTSHCTPAPPLSSSRRKSAALRREGVQPTRGQALPATESPGLPIPVSPRSSSPGPGGRECRGPGWSPQPRAAPCCSQFRGQAPPVAGVSAAGRGLRAQFPGAERGATAARGGFLRCCPSCSPPSSLSPPGLSALVAFWAPSPSTSSVSGSTRCQIHAHVLRSPTCSLHAWV